jgi:hypothetical protein
MASSSKSISSYSVAFDVTCGLSSGVESSNEKGLTGNSEMYSWAILEVSLDET